MVSTLQIGRVGRRSTGYPHEAGLCFLFLERGEVGYRGVEGADQARPANSRLSVETLTFSPSLMKRGTRISRPVWRRADLVTLPLDVSPRTAGSVWTICSSTKMGNCRPMGLPLYLCNWTRVPSSRKSNALP